MIKTIYTLGNKYLIEEKPAVIQAITLPIARSYDSTKYVIIVDFSIKDKKVKITPKEISESTHLELLWIGTADGAASPQWFGTVSNVEYLLSQTITNLLERWNQEDSYYSLLKEAQNVFFLDLGAAKKSDERYRYVFNPAYVGGELTEKEAKKAVKEAAKQFQAFIEKEANVSIKDVLLYSLAINGQLVVSQPEYERLVIAEKLSAFEEAKKGVCALTNKEAFVTGETTKLKFNYYINDKISFASNLEKKSFVKNLSISKDAYQAIMAGEAYILRNFNTRFSGLPCYIIPDFLYDVPFEDAPLQDISKRINQFVRTVKTVETAEALHRDIEDYKEFGDQMDNHISLHFLFYTKAQSALKVNKLLSDVPLTHLRRLGYEMRKAGEIGQRFFGNEKFNLGLEPIYYLIPMRIQRGENFEKRKILQVYESLLTNKPLSYQWLIAQFVQLAKVHMYASYSVYQYSDKKEYNDFNLVDAMVRAQLFLKLLQNLNLIKEEREMTKVTYDLPDTEMVEYMETMNYNVAQSSLFLLGYLIARIGSAQVGKANERAEAIGQARSGKTANKPILSKINYHGMNKQKLMMLSSEVFEKLRQLKIASLQNEAVYAEHKRLFDSALQEKWNLSDRESVFYLLSGYAYGTKRILGSVKKDDSKVENEE
ncbi:TIGR02556 family CRISPR-associated protein [Thermaerobacillus caldiproteolyticus]|uniref:TIGR02556 family CRISPR-associated protein n=1 Tax=Thermaerobacillus caldiproteolyticus TaxID=247480 RepID=UPI00188DB7D1|nr:TIGR02556 family CRISPR-associated protein [Anoxybacillus caldiproteolyticus]QPA31246.1 TIGR02556 family CRISPR-associated protein [Anoxybacillus caldiproteolyticus]